jgi:hypothetical protein
VVYLYLDRFRVWTSAMLARRATLALGDDVQHQPV